MVLRDAIDQPLNSEAVVDPAAGGVVEGRGNVDADPSVRRAGVEIEGWMLLAPLATAVRLAAGTVLEHERAADERLVGQDLDGAGAGLCSRASDANGVSWVLLKWLARNYTSVQIGGVKVRGECESARPRTERGNQRTDRTLKALKEIRCGTAGSARAAGATVARSCGRHSARDRLDPAGEEPGRYHGRAIVGWGAEISRCERPRPILAAVNRERASWRNRMRAYPQAWGDSWRSTGRGWWGRPLSCRSPSRTWNGRRPRS